MPWSHLLTFFVACVACCCLNACCLVDCWCWTWSVVLLGSDRTSCSSTHLPLELGNEWTLECKYHWCLEDCTQEAEMVYLSSFWSMRFALWEYPRCASSILWSLHQEQHICWWTSIVYSIAIHWWKLLQDRWSAQFLRNVLDETCEHWWSTIVFSLSSIDWSCIPLSLQSIMGRSIVCRNTSSDRNHWGHCRGFHPLPHWSSYASMSWDQVAIAYIRAKQMNICWSQYVSFPWTMFCTISSRMHLHYACIQGL